MPVIAALGVVLALWIVVGAACRGWGACLGRTLARDPADPAGGAALFWAGFAVLIGLLQVWQLFLPVDWRASVLLLGGGVVAGFATGTFRPPWAERPTAGRAVILVAVAFWLAYRGLDFPRNYDSGLYHFATIRWINEFAAVPGLANLHDRLGFNQAYFLFVALLNVHPFFGEGYHAANSLLGFALVAQLLGNVPSVAPGARPATAAMILCCLLVPVVLAQALGGDISSPTPDFAVFVVGLAVFVLLVEWLEKAGSGGHSHRQSAVILAVLLATGCTMKLSFAAFALAVAAVMLHASGRGRAAVGSPGRGTMALLLVGSGLLWGIPYALRGIILSGYPAFPSTILAWPGDWRLPVAEAEACAHWIRSWARTPGGQPAEVLGSWAWLGPWWQRTLHLPGVWLPLAITGGGALGLAAAAGRNGWRQVVRWLPPFAPLLAGLAGWFFTAPDPRFADWLLWLLAAWTSACAFGSLSGTRSSSLPRVLAGVTLVASLGVVGLGLPAWLQPRRYGFDSLPQVETREYLTRSGLKVFLPAKGRDVRLWDAALPAAPHGKPDLELRRADLGGGFRTAVRPPDKTD